MRIESNDNYASASPQKRDVVVAEGFDFAQILSQQNTTPAPARVATESLPLMVARDFGELNHESQSVRQELRAEEQELAEQREADFERGLEAREKSMEKLVDAWEDRGKDNQEMAEDCLIEGDESVAELLAEALEDAADENIEILSDFDDISLEHDDMFTNGDGQGHQRGTYSSEESADDQVTERAMNYQEIQSLIETVLLSPRHLPPRVRQVLQHLLEALLDGQRWLLTPDRLLGLEAEEFQIVGRLFPPHFYGGLLRESASDRLYPILQDLALLHPPDSQQQQALIQLWQPTFGGEVPLLLRNWILGQPLILDESLHHILEIWQQRQTLPPAAIGRTLQLALRYQHHPERQARLFALAGDYLHQRSLTDEQIDEVAHLLFERCYPREVADQNSTVGVLSKALKGQNLSSEDLGLLLQGCALGILSHLPYAYLDPHLQEILDYMQRDLLGREELLPQLLENA